jgi:GrpB-like predicted nucleotidyltransferase (UPF0157 family)
LVLGIAIYWAAHVCLLVRHAPHIAFRDALRSNPSLVSQYQELKEWLAVTFKDDRPSYTEGKASFIQAVIASVLRPAHNVG